MVPLKRVLVAEDQTADVLLLERAFAQTRLPIALHFVKDGQEAIDYLRGDKRYSDRLAHPLPDLVLLDLKMPRLDGFEVLRWLRQQPGLKRLPVSVFSSSALVTDVNRAYELGANSFLVKPNDLESLFNLVSRLEEYWLQVNHGPEGLGK